MDPKERAEVEPLATDNDLAQEETTVANSGSEEAEQDVEDEG